MKGDSPKRCESIHKYQDWRTDATLVVQCQREKDHKDEHFYLLPSGTFSLVTWGLMEDCFESEGI